MFEQRRDFPRAITAKPGGDERRDERAVRWLLEQTRQLGGQPLLYVPGKRNIDDHELLSALAMKISVATWSTLSGSGWRGGPVLAAWPDVKHLGEIDGDPRTTALVVLAWSEKDSAAWEAAFQPEMLSPGDVIATAPDLDPVVAEGLKTLTVLVNHANNLAGALDRRDAIAVLRALQDGGHGLNAHAIYVWAMANGWPTGGAGRLRELAQQISEGGKPRMNGPSPLRSDILHQWRNDAETEQD